MQYHVINQLNLPIWVTLDRADDGSLMFTFSFRPLPGRHLEASCLELPNQPWIPAKVTDRTDVIISDRIHAIIESALDDQRMDLFISQLLN